MLNKINEKLEYYSVELVSKAIGEDNRYLVGKGEEVVGYGVVNKDNGMVEYTTTILPTALFQADYMDKALKSLMTDEPAPEIEAEVASDDVLIN